VLKYEKYSQKKYLMGKVYNWFQERLEIQAIADDISSKYVPPHVNIFYCLGGITFVCFLVQVATGFAMTFYYRPSVADAFASVEYMMTQVNFGWLIRSIHRWSASMMVLMMILHVFRVYLTGGFKKPRELTWVTGVILASVTVSFGVTGYSLPWDQVGYWACKIVTGVPDAIPVVGANLVELLKQNLPEIKDIWIQERNFDQAKAIRCVNVAKTSSEFVLKEFGLNYQIKINQHYDQHRKQLR
jgi:cytochrome b6